MRRPRISPPAASLVVAAALFLAPASALGHAELIRSSPAADSSEDTAPATLTLAFSQPVVLDRTDITLLDPQGHVAASVGKGGFRLRPVASDQGAVVTTPLPQLGKGLYKVLWRSLSKDDYHSVGDQFVFAVGLPVPVGAGTLALPSEPRPKPLEAAFRWASFVGVAILAGATLLAIVLERRTRPDLAARSWRPAVVGAGIAIGGAVAQLLYQTSQAGLPIPTTISETTFGQGWLVRALLLAAAFVVTLVGRSMVAVWAAAVLALAAAAAGAIGSHASAYGHLATGMLALHLTAAAAWAGVVFIAAVVFGPSLREPSTREDSLVALRAVAVIAVPAVVVLAITGLYSLGRHVANVDALLTSIYGATLLIKTALVVMAAILGALTHRLVRSQGGIPRVLRSLPVEAGALAAALLAAAVMAAGAPARGVRFAEVPAVAPPSSIAVQQVGDLLISLEIKPNAPGANFVTARVLNTRRPPPADIQSVTINVGGTRIAATPLAIANQSDCNTDGETPYRCHWEAPVTIARPGAVPIGVTVTRPTLPDTSLQTNWTVGGGAVLEAPATVVSRARLGPFTLWLAVLVAVAAAAGLALMSRRGRAAT
jgi:copper transport protein